MRGNLVAITDADQKTEVNGKVQKKQYAYDDLAAYEIVFALRYTGRQTISPAVARVSLEFWSVGKLPRILEASRATADPIKTLAVLQLNALVVHLDEIPPSVLTIATATFIK
ncbi:hypothetical protein PsorP6_007536 [Peronosclerospora sorghi]|uniref:Uncharacterized protein n=1 Tax=Peronosclerospora sorghi TaxID=230839 RepID=A0ACC0WBC5_9STRA|nr:hypothetical protein PsorP6_007536 [Peronosclerospora sorghi]